MVVFEFSQSVSHYLSDPRVKIAVDELVGSKRMLSGFDPAFEWEEFPKFVDAWVSSQKVVGDWAKDLSRLWDEVWGAEMSPIIPYTSRAQALEDLADGGLSEAWYKSWYARAIKCADQSVNLVIFYEEREGRRGIHLQVEPPEKSKNLKIVGWELNEDKDFDGPFHPLLIRDGSVTVELDAVREDARNALGQLGILSA